MSQTCPNCGTAVPAGQRFCSNCGTDMGTAGPASQYGGPPPQNFPQVQPQQPPYTQPQYCQQSYQQYQPYQQYQQPQITTAPINQTVTYESVDITIVSVQQSRAFIDDSSTAANGMIRVNIKEANNSGSNASYFYSDMTHLILANKSTVAPVSESQTS